MDRLFGTQTSADPVRVSYVHSNNSCRTALILDACIGLVFVMFGGSDGSQDRVIHIFAV